MKTLKLTVSLLALGLASMAQPFGKTTYGRAGYILSTGAISTSANSGFLMAGVVRNLPVGAPNFYIDRTNIGGAFNGSFFEFSKEYTIQSNSSCGTPLSNPNNCAGVTVIETGADYALTGAFSDGVFFATLSSSGNIVNKTFYNFPVGSTSPSKPIIISSTVANEYLICGSYTLPNSSALRMYLLKVNGSGTTLSSRQFSSPSGFVFRPKDMILSPYNTNEFVVVGEAITNAGTMSSASRGFFARFNVSNLINTSCRIFGQTLNISPIGNDFFESIEVSNASGGYVISGYSNANTQGLWALNLNSNGSVINWNTLPRTVIGGTSVGPMRNLSAITERNSSVTGNYMYYALVENSQPNYMTVIKLDANGVAYVPPSVPPPAAFDFINEFSFFGLAGMRIIGSAISHLDNGGPNDIGIQVFGTENGGASASNYLFVEAAFNGATGCSGDVLTNQNPALPGPSVNFLVGLNPITGLQTCTNFILSWSSPLNSWAQNCGSFTLPTTPLQGSQTRQIKSGGVVSASETKVNVFPNPASKQVNITLQAIENDKIEVKIVNTLGQLVFELSPATATETGTFSKTIDMDDAKLASGIYFISVKVNDKIFKEKLQINK